MLRVFEDDPPVVVDAQILAYIDGAVAVLPPERAQNAKAVKAVSTWLQKRIEVLGVVLNRKKS